MLIRVTKSHKNIHIVTAYGLSGENVSKHRQCSEILLRDYLAREWVPVIRLTERY